MMKYCAYCGNTLQDDMLFCSKCGKKAIVGSVNANDKDSALNISQTIVKRNLKKRGIGATIGLVAITTIIVLCAVIFARDFSKRPSAMERAAESVVLVNCYDRFGELRATGSGFVMYNDSTIITNYHVIDRALAIEISTDEDHTFIVESVLAFDKEKDIAILQTAEPTGLKCLPTGNSKDMKKGESVIAIGSPLGSKNTVSTGVLSGRWYNNTNGIDELQFSAPISSGSSGGALFNKRGQVVGITSATIIDSQNLNLAIPIEIVAEVYKNKNPITVEKSFQQVYKGASDYLDSKNVFVEYADLYSNPEKYLGKIITTLAYIVPTDGYEFLAFASAEDMRYVSKYDEIAFYCQPTILATQHVEKEYSGYAIMCGVFDGYLGEYEVVASGNGLTIAKIPHLKLSISYIELLK